MKKKEVVIIGAGKFGSAIIENLKESRKFKIILIDNDEENLKEYKDTVDKVYLGDSGNEKFMKEIGVESADIFVIGIGDNVQSSVLTASIIIENFKNARVICKASNKQHEDILRKIGVTEIVSPERAAAKRAFFRIISPIYGEETNSSGDEGEFATEFEGDISIIKIPVRVEWVGFEVKNLKLPADISIILIYRKNNNVVIVKGNTTLVDGDKLLILGHNKDLINILNK